jgi:hypothetical protein
MVRQACSAHGELKRDGLPVTTPTALSLADASLVCSVLDQTFIA